MSLFYFSSETGSSPFWDLISNVKNTLTVWLKGNKHLTILKLTRNRRPTRNGAHNLRQFCYIHSRSQTKTDSILKRRLTFSTTRTFTYTVHIHPVTTIGLFIVCHTYKGQNDTYVLASPSDFNMPPVLHWGVMHMHAGMNMCVYLYVHTNGELSLGFCKPVCVAVRQK